MSTPYPFKKIEAKWQQLWHQEQSFKIDDLKIDDGVPQKKYYVLEMFPYPSGRIHMGHVRNYTLGDICARFKRAQGYQVLHPMAWDAFGLPAENAARTNNNHPKDWTVHNIDCMREELKSIGFSYDWSREFTTCDPEYYRFEQQFIIDFFKAGLLYRKESLINWDPIENTVLANEQVVDGRGWRSNAIVEQRLMPQWYLKITQFAADLLAGLDTLKHDWPDKVLTMQKNWIGESQGAEIRFIVQDSDASINIFTTRPDTIYGCSFIALSIHHPFIEKACITNSDVQNFVQQYRSMGTAQADLDKLDKHGVHTGFYVRHPLDQEHLVPIFVANFVIMDYGTGAVMGVPGHDGRDYEFACQYDLPIKHVIKWDDDQPQEDLKKSSGPYTGFDGHLINSPLLNGMTVPQAQKKVVEIIESRQCGKGVTTYRLRDWCISRQRFWGCPIPFVHCPHCGIVPEKSENLPIMLPDDVSFDQPGNPLDHHPTWKFVSCPQCDQPAQRETDTLDTFVESSWYFMRLATQPTDQAFDKTALDNWLGVDKYIGGVEHAVMHLLYARFFTRALNQCGYTNHVEPFKSLVTQGMVCHQTYQTEDGGWVYPDDVIVKDGVAMVERTKQPVIVGRSIKMSKSKRNVVTPQSIRDAYGVDTARMFVVSDTPPDRDLEWSEAGVQGVWRFISRVWRYVNELAPQLRTWPPEGLPGSNYDNATNLALKQLIHKTIAGVTHDYEHFNYNLAIAKLRALFNQLELITTYDVYQPAVISMGVHTLIQLFSPIIPHVCEELWQHLGHDHNLVHYTWPTADPEYLVNQSFTIAVQVNGKLRATIQSTGDESEAELQNNALNYDNVKRVLDGMTIHKVICIPQKVINIVCS